jgi:hypothetical protein
VSIEALRNDRKLQRELLAILSPLYREPDVPLSFAMQYEASHVYVHWEVGSSDVRCFFFGRYPERVPRIIPWVVYMGLTACIRDARPAHTARLLWKRFLSDVRYAVGPGAEILAWYRTATPFGLYPCHQLLFKGEPTADGGFSAWGVACVDSLRQHYQIGVPTPGDHPFVLRACAGARYSQAESERIQNAGKNHLLTALNIQEERGDRLVMLGFVR